MDIFFSFHTDTPEAHKNPLSNTYIVEMDRAEASLKQIRRKMVERKELNIGLCAFSSSPEISKFRILNSSKWRGANFTFNKTLDDIEQPLIALSNYIQKHKYQLEYYLDVLHSLMDVYSFKDVEYAIAEVEDLEYTLPQDPEAAAREFFRLQSPRLSQMPDFKAFSAAIKHFCMDTFLCGIVEAGYRTHCSDNHIHVFKNKQE